MNQTWQAKRTNLNHDWLKNVYLTALEKWVNVLDDRVDDPGFERDFLSERFSQWPERQQSAERLIVSFESDMSPKTLLDRPPLQRCRPETKVWLGSLIHALWLSRQEVAAMIRDAKEHMETADALYKQLDAALVTRLGTCLDDLRPLRDDFAAFYSACALLAASVSRFPNSVKVV